MVKFIRRRVPKHLTIWMLVLLLLLFQVMASYAATATPVPPTATPVPLDIPVGVVMSSTNGWISTFAPIAAIGIGISIALAILGYLGKMIKGAFS